MTRPENPDSTISVCTIAPETYLQRLDELVDLHLRAMGYGRVAFTQRRILWAANASHPGFTAIIALNHSTADLADPTDLRQRIVGIAYGFPGQPSSWWYREVHRGLRGAGHTAEEAAEILRDYDEVSEIHVLPEYQGLGIGREMLTDLLGRLQRPTAMLSTPEVPEEDNAAWSLYRSLGFHDILRDFRFASDPRPFSILSKTRPTPGTQHPS